MMDDNDKLLERFFAENKQEVKDNGFSCRVMQHLPDNRRVLLSRLWSAVGGVLALVLFLAFDGLQLLTLYIPELVRETFGFLLEQSVEAQVDPCTLLLAGLILLYFGYKKVLSLA